MRGDFDENLKGANKRWCASSSASRTKWHHQSLEAALIERLRREGFAGATVLRGVAGFGANSVIHTTGIQDLSSDLPVIVEIVDSEEQIQKLLTILDEMLNDGLVTMEKVACEGMRRITDAALRGAVEASPGHDAPTDFLAAAFRSPPTGLNAISIV